MLRGKRIYHYCGCRCCCWFSIFIKYFIESNYTNKICRQNRHSCQGRQRACHERRERAEPISFTSHTHSWQKCSDGLNNLWRSTVTTTELWRTMIGSEQWCIELFFYFLLSLNTMKVGRGGGGGKRETGKPATTASMNEIKIQLNVMH